MIAAQYAQPHGLKQVEIHGFFAFMYAMSVEDETVFAALSCNAALLKLLQRCVRLGSCYKRNTKSWA